MSGPSTVLVLDAQAGSPAHKYLDAPDRLVVVTDSPSLALHALSTMSVAVFVCDLAAAADFKSLATIAQVASPNVRILFTGAKPAETKARQILQAANARGSFFPRPWNGIALRKAVADETAAGERDAASGGAVPEEDAAPAGGAPRRAAAAPGAKRVIRIASPRTGAARASAAAPAAKPAEPPKPRGPQGPDPSAYEIVELLGRGGTGTVFHARDKFLGIDVALKVVNRDLVEKPGVLESFKDEARITMQLSHRCILRLYGFHVYNGCYYIVMEQVRGRPLRDIILEGGALSTETACRILQQVGSALGYAHAHNVVHKDVKPENVYLTEAGELKVIDFGSAVLRDASQEDGYVVGTPEYMPPEQLRGEVVGPPADVYALAIMTYLMLMGCYPFPAGTTVEQLLEGVRPDFSALPEPLAGVLAKGTACEVAFRYQNVAEFVRDVLAACGCTELERDVFAPVAVRTAAEAAAEAAAGVP